MALNTFIVKGKIYWAKIVGEPTEDQYKGLGWSFDLAVDEATKEDLIRRGCPANKFKNKDDDRGDFLQFFRAAEKRDGTPGSPFKIVDSHKKDWTDAKIGNGSDVNIQMTINDWKFAGKSGKKPAVIAIQIWDLIPYGEGSGGFQEKKDSDIDDDLPF